MPKKKAGLGGKKTAYPNPTATPSNGVALLLGF
jgi:hypothetical protein